MNWYILKVAKGQDHKVKTNLENKIKTRNLSEFVSQVLVPTEKYMEIKKNKRVTKERPLLAGYVILNADLSKDTTIKSLLSVPGVLGFMGEKRTKPTRIPENEITRLLGKMEKINTDSIWLEGERVSIIDGPFSTFEGEITKVDESKGRVNVEVKIFGRPTNVELKFDAIKKIN